MIFWAMAFESEKNGGQLFFVLLPSLDPYALATYTQLNQRDCWALLGVLASDSKYTHPDK